MKVELSPEELCEAITLYLARKGMVIESVSPPEIRFWDADRGIIECENEEDYIFYLNETE